MKTADFVSAKTDVRGLDEYHRHEANAVEDCAECAARRPGSLRDWIFAHPYWIVAMVVGACMMLGVLLELVTA